MSKKMGLGKGLGALIPEEDNKSSIKTVSINLIKPNEDQPRKKFDEDKILQLAQSVKKHGIIQPLIVNKKNDIYIIVAGERRWRAAKIAGIKEVPVVNMNLDNKNVLEISLIENIQRQDLNCIEEAKAYKKLIDNFKITQENLSERIGKSRTAISNCMRLVNLDERVQSYLIDEVITEGHGRALLSIQDNDLQYETAKKIIDDSLSVRETEKLIRILNKDSNENNKEKDNKELSPYYTDIKNKLENVFNTKVNLKNKKNKGKIEIEYYSQDDLQRILEILKI
ncbi:ParB/RepB/Spo0J family partition protein [Clostridium niameyense]|uniref:ParB/RepB/Spo0J family partition protein n=1 Tax=Clostridium niameyense TaxID=1622073 RepID=A0A6M0RC45_9CLOT|nr:ParB/RepB/Spo0J family partition protein [Clostridium niameyense]NEZ47865.1 ParB/RepB/Spo0J family partition protein [Clostridium niameyense]